MATPSMVIYPLTLPTLLNHLLTTPSPARTTLIICSSRETFLQDLLSSLSQQGQHHGERLQHLISPTLHNLATARHVELVFCASVPALLAYLTAPSGAGSKLWLDGVSGGTVKGKMLLVNPLGLHAPTPSFSAQGLSRMFAAAVEAAVRVGAALVVAECQRGYRATVENLGEGDVDMERGEEELRGDDETEADPWEQEVSILNVSAKKFGSGNSDRAWAGRTVQVKRVAARWFHFHRLNVP